MSIFDIIYYRIYTFNCSLICIILMPLASTITQLYSFLYDSELTSPIKIHGATMLDHNVLSSLFALNILRPQSCV